MLSIYANTNQGKQTRSRILVVLDDRDGLTRNELVAESGLTYEQVRRQTRNLAIEGKIESRIHAGQRRYYVKIFALLLIAIMPISGALFNDDSIKAIDQNLTDS